MKRPEPTKVYLFLSFTSGILFASLFGIPYYETVTAGFNPLQLMIVGMAMELSRLVFEVPTGVIADLYSRRLSVVIGYTLIGLSLISESLFPFFVPILLAQMVWGLGYTFISGAIQAWLSDEIGEERANRALLTANRYDLSGNVVGVIAAMLLGSLTSVSVMIFVSGTGWILLAVVLRFLMSEEGFSPVKPADRNTIQHMFGTLTKGVRTVRLRPTLLAVLGVALFYGMTAGFDRLWVWQLLDRFELPVLFGNNQLAFFGVLEFAGILLSIALTRQVEKRFETLQPRSVGRLMLAVTITIAIAIAAFGLSPFLGLALGLYLIIYSLRELTDPLINAWMNQRLDSDVRATILSMTGQTEAIGQVTGGLTIGLLAKIYSVPLALVVCGGLLIPAIGFIIRANRTQTQPTAEAQHALK